MSEENGLFLAKLKQLIDLIPNSSEAKKCGLNMLTEMSKCLVEAKAEFPVKPQPDVPYPRLCHDKTKNILEWYVKWFGKVKTDE